LVGLGIIGLDTGQNSGVGLGMNKYTQIYAAFVTNKDDDLKALLTPDTLNHIYTVPGSTNKASLLGLAILLKRTELATYLVNQGADIAKVSDKDQSALFFAIRMYISLVEKAQDTTAMLALIELLVEKGADISPIMPIITSWSTKIAPTYDQDGARLLALITSLNRKNIREQQARDEQLEKERVEREKELERAKEIEVEQEKERMKEQEKTDLVATTLLASALAPTPTPVAALAKAPIPSPVVTAAVTPTAPTPTAPTAAVAALAPTPVPTPTVAVAALAKAPIPTVAVPVATPVPVPDILVRSILLTARALASRTPTLASPPVGPGSSYTPLPATAGVGSGYTPLPSGPVAAGPLPLPAAAASAAGPSGFTLPEFKFPELGSLFGRSAAPAGRFLYSPATALAATSRVTAANKALKEAVAAGGSAPTPTQLAEIARLRGAVEEAAAEKRATDDYVGSSLQRTQQRIKQYRAWMDTYKNNTISAQIDDARDPMLRDYLELEERAGEGDEAAIKQLARFRDRTILIDDVETTILNPYKAARYRGASDGSSFNSDGRMFAADNAVVQKLMPELVGDKRAVNAILESLWYCGTKQEIGSDPRCFPERYMGLLRKYGSKAVRFAPVSEPEAEVEAEAEEEAEAEAEAEEEAEVEAEAEEEAEAEYEELAATATAPVLTPGPVLTPVLTPAQRAAEALRRRGAEGRAGAAARVRFAKTSAPSVE